MQTQASVVLSERSGSVLTLSINRPEQRNSLTVATAKALYAELVRAAQDESLKAVVLRGRGRDFCCGADINAGAAHSQAESERLIQDLEPYDVTLLLHNMPAVTIAAIRGGCAGAALGWACACDIRIAGTSARFNTAFLDVGVAGDMAGPWLLPRLIGATRARDLYFFPRKFTADEAFSMGLVAHVFAESEFEGALAQMTARLDAAAPLALKAIKANFLDAERLDLKAYIAIESKRHVELYASADRSEAFRAFVEKRKPRFVGR
jgi:2-(1,2-epoxy-1,2-dihydrophenyl)acetyl-CoA isomerase